LFLENWIVKGWQTRNGYTLEQVKLIQQKARKLIHVRNGYMIAKQIK
jgi:hypothetical protein